MEEEEEDHDRPPLIDWDEEGEANIVAIPSEEERVSFVKDNLGDDEEEESY